MAMMSLAVFVSVSRYTFSVVKSVPKNKMVSIVVLRQSCDVFGTFVTEIAYPGGNVVEKKALAHPALGALENDPLVPS